MRETIFTRTIRIVRGRGKRSLARASYSMATSASARARRLS
jgi:hypothetical protein